MSYLKLLFVLNFVIQLSYADTNQIGKQGSLSELFPGGGQEVKQNSLTGPAFDASKLYKKQIYDAKEKVPFGNAPLQMSLNFGTAEMALGSTRVKSFLNNQVKKLHSNGPSEDYIESYCKDFLDMMSTDPHLMANQILASDSMISGNAGDIEVNEFVDQYKYLNHISKSVVEEFSFKECDDKIESCLGGFGENLKAQDSLLDSCKNHMKVNILNQEEDLSLVAKESFGVSETEALLEELKEAGHSNPHNNKVCASEQSCLFNRPEGYHTSCNTFNCSMAGSSFGKAAFNELGSAFILSSDSFDLTGSEEFCSSCFKKAAKQLKQDYDPKLIENTFENKVAGKKGAKKLLSLAEVMETAHDFNALQNRDQSRIGCEGELDQMLKNKCGNDEANRNFDIRLKEAEKFLKIDPTNSTQFFRELSELVLPAPGANSCQRSSYAIYKRNQWIGPTNAPAREGFKSILRELKNRPGLQALVEKNCDGSPESKQDFVDSYSEELSKDVMRKLGHILTPETLNTSGGLQAAICSSEDKFLVDMGCNDSNKVRNKNANKYFSTFHSSYNSVLGVLADHYKSRDRDPKTLEKITDTIQRMVQGQIKTTMELASNYDPFIKINMESWDNFCKMNDQLSGKKGLDIADYLDTVPGKKQVEQFRSSQCKRVIAEAKEELCGDVPFESNKDTPLPFSKDDIALIRDELIQDYNYNVIGINSLSCKLKSLELNDKGRFDKESAASFNPNFSIGASDLERAYAIESNDGGKVQSDMPLDFNRFKKFHNCNGKFAEVQKSIYETRSDSKVFFSNIDSTEVAVVSGKLSSEAAKINESRGNRLNELAIFTGADNLSEVVYSTPSSGRSDFLGTLEKGRVVATQASSVESSPLNNIPVASSEEAVHAKRAFTKTTGGDVKPIEGDQEYGNLFDYVSDSSNGNSFEVAAKNSQFQASGRMPASNLKTPVCDDKCLQEILDRKPNGFSDEEKFEVAEKVGIVNPKDSTDQMKQMLEDVLDGKLKSNELEDLRKENEKLRMEMADIRKSIEQKDKPVKVIDSNGDDRAKEILSPESNSALVFNPRNNSANEFKSRSYYDEKKEQFAPDYQESSTPERLSLGDYSSRRREAAKIPVDQVKQYNADIDQSFLKSHTNSPVDENFVRSYVSHVNKEAGSIEHLIVFENGVPAKIRVPDPQKPGAYVEHPIAEGMVDEILGKVEKQEVQSYAVYNMVNFGQSLQDFMNNLSNEASNITSLEVLNQQLKGLNSLE